MTKHSSWRARASAALAAALAIGAVALLTAAPPASAGGLDGPHCRHDRNYNACFSLDWLAPESVNYENAYVGIDVYLPEQYGRDIIACGADFKATLRGDDGKGDHGDGKDHNQVIRNLEIQPGWPIADSTGIAAEFIGSYIAHSELNEDATGEDEIYARVSYYDCHNFETHYFNTGYIVTFF
jgi:hypothetical protein